MGHQSQRNPKSRNPVRGSHGDERVINCGKDDCVKQVDGSENVKDPYCCPRKTRTAQHERDCYESEYGRYKIAKCRRVSELRWQSCVRPATGQEHHPQMTGRMQKQNGKKNLLWPKP